jgi:hypothetical protein
MQYMSVQRETFETTALACGAALMQRDCAFGSGGVCPLQLSPRPRRTMFWRTRSTPPTRLSSTTPSTSLAAEVTTNVTTEVTAPVTAPELIAKSTAPVTAEVAAQMTADITIPSSQIISKWADAKSPPGYDSSSRTVQIWPVGYMPPPRPTARQLAEELFATIQKQSACAGKWVPAICIECVIYPEVPPTRMATAAMDGPRRGR